jgi:hypothetical protein
MKGASGAAFNLIRRRRSILGNRHSSPVVIFQIPFFRLLLNFHLGFQVSVRIPLH